MRITYHARVRAPACPRALALALGHGPLPLTRSPARSRYYDQSPHGGGRGGRKVGTKKAPLAGGRVAGLGWQGPEPLGLLNQHGFFEAFKAIDAEVEDFASKLSQPKQTGLSKRLAQSLVEVSAAGALNRAACFGACFGFAFRLRGFVV